MINLCAVGCLFFIIFLGGGGRGGGGGKRWGYISILCVSVFVCVLCALSFYFGCYISAIVCLILIRYKKNLFIDNDFGVVEVLDIVGAIWSEAGLSASCSHCLYYIAIQTVKGYFISLLSYSVGNV